MNWVKRWVLFHPKVELPIEWDYGTWQEVTRGHYSACVGRMCGGTIVEMVFLKTPIYLVVTLLFLAYLAYIAIFGISRQVGYVRFYWRNYRSQR